MSDATDKIPFPHHVRFARAIALVGGLAITTGCCPMIPDSLACQHCTCSWQTRSFSQPLACDTLHRDSQCCTPILPLAVPGPLYPPDLPA